MSSISLQRYLLYYCLCILENFLTAWMQPMPGTLLRWYLDFARGFLYASQFYIGDQNMCLHFTANGPCQHLGNLPKVVDCNVLLPYSWKWKYSLYHVNAFFVVGKFTKNNKGLLEYSSGFHIEFLRTGGGVFRGFSGVLQGEKILCKISCQPLLIRGVLGMPKIYAPYHSNRYMYVSVVICFYTVTAENKLWLVRK